MATRRASAHRGSSPKCDDCGRDSHVAVLRRRLNFRHPAACRRRAAAGPHNVRNSEPASQRHEHRAPPKRLPATRSPPNRPESPKRGRFGRLGGERHRGRGTERCQSLSARPCSNSTTVARADPRRPFPRSRRGLRRDTRTVRAPLATTARATHGRVDQQARQRGGTPPNPSPSCLIRPDRLRPAVRWWQLSGDLGIDQRIVERVACQVDLGLALVEPAWEEVAVHRRLRVQDVVL